MGRGYWLPPGAENLPLYDGFYVDSAAVYTGGDVTADWQAFLNEICSAMQRRDGSLQRLCEWVPCDLGQSRFVLLQNEAVQIIAEDADGYIAVYAIVPENCVSKRAQRVFQNTLQKLRCVLTGLYPGFVSRRLNSQHIEKVG
ncbi:MAG: hypothetical protein IJT66_01440 [Clostridia bacterium]|nr:hypothetical protein [Clostridia bacterium]